jgi:hypothetical protein
MPSFPWTKPDVHAACVNNIANKVAALRLTIAETQADNEYDGKSSAGDKHETATAMAHLELEKLHQSLSHQLDMNNVMLRIDPSTICETIVQGALIRTNNGPIYIAAALGQIEVKGEKVMVLSYGSPLVSALAKLPLGTAVRFNEEEWVCLNCC